MLCLGLIIHTDIFRLQENPGEIRQELKPIQKTGMGRSVGTRRHTANCATCSSSQNWFIPSRKKWHHSVTNRQLNLAVDHRELRDFTNTLKNTESRAAVTQRLISCSCSRHFYHTWLSWGVWGRASLGQLMYVTCTGPQWPRAVE